MTNYNFKKVTEFYNLLSNSNDFYVCDKDACHYGHKERERIFSYRNCNVYVNVVLRDCYKTSYLTQNTANVEYSRSSTFTLLNLGRMPTRLLKL